MVVTTTPATVFARTDTWTTIPPRPHRPTARWSPTARLLQFLLDHDINDWSAIDLATLEALYEETLAYPSMEDAWDDEDDADRDWIDHAFHNAWHVVCGGDALVPHQRLPVVPVLTHPFY